MKTFPGTIAAAVVVVVAVLWCRPSPSSASRRTVAATDSGKIDDDHRSLDILRENADEDEEDRSKRQLSFVQSRLLNFLKPLPVVDVMKEEEKYGNDGDKFNRIGRGFIGGVEKVSSMLTSALSFPVDSAKKLSRSATEMLNNLGGRLVGLQR